MTCHEAREGLSAYVDEALAPEERGRVEAHLVSCAECQRELARLRQTVALLQRVQPVRAPVGFVDRVVAAARPRPWYRRVADAVLLPLAVKLPLQLTAAVMIGLLAVYLFERTPELQRAERQEAPRPEAPAEPPADKVTRSAPSVQAPPEASSRARTGDERERRDTPGLRDTTPPAAAPAPAPPAAAPAPVVAPRPETGPVPEAKTEAPSESMGATARPEAESRPRALERGAEPARPVPASPRLAAKRAPPSADVVARVAVKDRDAAERELAALIARVGGSVAQRRSEEDATVVEALIPQPRYAEFSESLTRIGSWRVEAERPDLPAQIRVVLRLQ